MIAIFGGVVAFCLIAIVSTKLNPLPAEEKARINRKINRIGQITLALVLLMFFLLSLVPVEPSGR